MDWRIMSTRFTKMHFHEEWLQRNGFGLEHGAWQFDGQECPSYMGDWQTACNTLDFLSCWPF